MTPARSIPCRKVEAAMTNLGKMTTALADELRVIADDIWSGEAQPISRSEQAPQIRGSDFEGGAMKATCQPFSSEELGRERILLTHECAVRQCSELNAVRDDIDRRYLATIDALAGEVERLSFFEPCMAEITAGDATPGRFCSVPRGLHAMLHEFKPWNHAAVAELQKAAWR